MCQPSASSAIECDINPAAISTNHHRGGNTDHNPRPPLRMRKIRNEIVPLAKTGVISSMHFDQISAICCKIRQKISQWLVRRF
jgi:hypothetical protein